MLLKFCKPLIIRRSYFFEISKLLETCLNAFDDKVKEYQKKYKGENLSFVRFYQDT